MLSTPDCAFYVHVDKKSDISDFSGIYGDNVFMSEQRVPVYWAEFSQVEVAMLLIRQALASSANYDYFALLHGSDYPLQSGQYIRRFLEANSGAEFISMVRVPAPGYPLTRINHLWYPSDQPIKRFVMRALGKIGLAERDYRAYLCGLEAYAGDACWTLSRAACLFILEFMQANPHVVRFFRDSFGPDETFFHTILGNSPFGRRARRSVLYTDWPGGGPHPSLLDEKQISYFEQQERICVEDQFGPGEALFARKFSDTNLDLVDRMDALIQRKESLHLAP